MIAWQHRAACVGTDPDVFFDGSRVAEAQTICARCPVASQCREHAVNATAGVWAGEGHKRKSAGSLTVPYLEQCGTRAGYERHLKRGQQPCGRCTVAKRFAQRDRTSA